MTAAAMSLWSDPCLVDLLSFDAVAQTVADAPLDEALDPGLVPRQATFALLMSAARLTTLRSRGSVA